jgi:hypothetical protein
MEGALPLSSAVLHPDSADSDYPLYLHDHVTVSPYETREVNSDSGRTYTEINYIQLWLLKPLQGIALTMLLAVKLITFLQIYVDESITGNIILPTGQFQLTRLLSINIVLIIASIFLSFLWTLDGLRIRYYNTKSGEVRMIGKYVGVLLPIIFGLYGMITLFKDSDRYLAIWNILQIGLVLYSPFVMLAVVHFLYIQSKETVLIKRLNILK